ncbi:MAG: hypothetical protein ACXWKB_09290, partial [Methyloceanibacter sp.]
MAKSRHLSAKTSRTAAAKVKVEAAGPPPLPDRNPNRTASGDSATPQPIAAGPQAITVTPQAVQGDATTTGSVGLTTSNVAPTDALAASQVLTPPDRNPNAVAAVTPSVPDHNPSAPGADVAKGATPMVNPTSDQAAHVSIVPLPDRNPKGLPPIGPAEEISLLPHSPSLVPPPPPAPQQAPAPAPAAPAGVTDDTPLPDPNPNRKATLPVVLKGTLTPAIQPPAPGLDYVSILKPLTSYELSDADESALRDVMHGGGSAAASTIRDEAARAFALWVRYRATGINGSAEAIEQFRLDHPYWPGQDELREKAETALFLNDASPETVKAFFASSSPQTGAGKAALASVYLKEDNEQGARDLVTSAWRDHELNQAVETKILAKYGYMLTADVHRARIDRLL